MNKKRLIIIHGWDGHPSHAWFPWIKKEFEVKDFEVLIPEMPHPLIPTIKDWVAKVDEVVGVLDEDTYLIGHSIGCQTILRYLEKLTGNDKVGGVVLVAPFFVLTNLKTDEEKGIAGPWLGKSMDYDKIKDVTNGKITAIFSDNDIFVPVKNEKLFKDRLGAKTIIQHEQRHFYNIKELPIARDEMLEYVR